MSIRIPRPLHTAARLASLLVTVGARWISQRAGDGKPPRLGSRQNVSAAAGIDPLPAAPAAPMLEDMERAATAAGGPHGPGAAAPESAAARPAVHIPKAEMFDITALAAILAGAVAALKLQAWRLLRAAP